MLYIVAQLIKGELLMSTVTVRLNEEEKRLFNKYAKLNNKPLSTIFKESLEQKIENEVDLKAILEYEENLRNNEVEYIPFDEVKKRLGM